MREFLQFVGYVIAPMFTAAVVASPFVPDWIARFRRAE